MAEDTSTSARAGALGRVALAYALAFVAAAACLAGLDWLDRGALIGRLALADLAATAVVFGFSWRWDNSSVYDPYWSVIPIWLASWLAWIGWSSGADATRAILVLALVVGWGARLTHNWARGWTGFAHEDWRYRDIRAATGRYYWPASFLAIHLFPTILVFLGCLPLIVVFTTASAPLGWLDGLALIVTAGAIVIEGLADNTLRAHVLRRERPGETLTEGVWAWSRHPNYFGELSFWWGLYLFGVAAGGWRPAWMISGALAMTALFNFVSVPLIEARMRKRRSDYAQVEARVSRLIPWFPRRR